jgi:hypothetical protein
VLRKAQIVIRELDIRKALFIYIMTGQPGSLRHNMQGAKCHAALYGESGVSNGSAESIRQRLLNLAKERGEDFDYVLRQYVFT